MVFSCLIFVFRAQNMAAGNNHCLEIITKIVFCLWSTDVATEKTQKSLFDGIEKFDATQLKHTETQEKNPLPDKDGNIKYSFCKLFSIKSTTLKHDCF